MKLFHLIKVDHRVRQSRGYRLGDLYGECGGNAIRAVINPDCDVVARNDKIKAENILTMGGTLNIVDEDDINKDGFSADDVFLWNADIQSVRWNPKDLKTFPTCGVDSLLATEKFCFLGTLRPLYAQEMQRRALADLSRIGLPVSPALGINVRAKVWMPNNKGEPIELELGKLAGTGNKSFSHATIILPRGGRDPYVLFRRVFVFALIDRLNEISSEEMKACNALALNKGLKNEGKALMQKLLGKGTPISRSIFGIRLFLGDRPSRGDKPSGKDAFQIGLAVSGEDMEDLGVQGLSAESLDEDKGS